MDGTNPRPPLLSHDFAPSGPPPRSRWTVVLVVVVAAVGLVWFFRPSERVPETDRSTPQVSMAITETAPATPPAGPVAAPKDPTPKPSSRPVDRVEAASQPPARPQPAPVAEPAPQPAAESAPRPVAEPAQQPVAEPAPQPAADKSIARDYFAAGTEAMDAGRFDEAVEKYQAAIEADPDLVDAYINLGNIYFFEHQDAALARRMYETALKLDPKNALVHNNIGVSFLQDGDLNEAETHLSAAVEIDPNYVDGWYNMACLAARREQESLAMDRLLKAGRNSPDVAIWAANDEDLRSLRDMPDFREFIGQSSREQ